MTSKNHTCKEDINYWGFGFGVFEYRCRICEKVVREVPREEMTKEETIAVFGVMDVVERAANGWPRWKL